MVFTNAEKVQMVAVLKLYRSWMYHTVKDQGDEMEAASKSHYVQSLSVITSAQRKLEESLQNDSQDDVLEELLGGIDDDRVEEGDRQDDKKTKKKIGDVNVLVTDDDEVTVELISAVLDDIGFANVENARDGQEALDKILANDNGYDLIICDWRMPNLNGLEVHAKAIDANKLTDTTFVLLTAIDDEVLAERAEKQGISFYLTKPFEADEFEQKIKAVFDFG
ncbi:MAG: response regulator [Agarilytica sp.]